MAWLKGMETTEMNLMESSDCLQESQGSTEPDMLPKELCIERAFAWTTANLYLDIRQFKCGKVSNHT